MHCHLLIPHLLPPPAQAPRLPALERLLTRGRGERSGDGAMEAWLCRAFGVARQQDWPLAPLTLTADGGRPEDYYWLRADPVYLRPERDQLVLADSGAFALSQDEARQLCDTLNSHFGPDGLIFYPLRPDRWYLRLERPPLLHTHPLPAVTGRGIDPFLPHGPDAMRWHAVFNEIQMLLYGHPANVEREARGELPVNSVWFWGGGSQPQAGARPFDAVWANDPLARGLAAAAGVAGRPLPATGEEWLAAAAGPRTPLVVLNALCGAGQYGDALGWREGLQQLEQDWFGPLGRALGRGALEALTLHATETGEARSFTVRRADLWRLWRRPRPLAAYGAEGA